nr:unnamed protein product [Mus musculus]
MGSIGSGVMGATEVLTSYCVVLCLLQMVALSSGHFTVIGSQRPILATLGGNVELNCQLSPPQQAQHMEIRWFRNRYTQPVHLYRNGKNLHGETMSKYVERTELLTDAFNEGKVILRILNVTVDDGGAYHCVFKDGEFYEEHITEVKVTATSSDIQILMHTPNIKGVMLECHSGGWFPQPHMEWRNSKGEVIQATSKFHSQDKNKLFNMSMVLFIEASSHRNVICYFQNLVTHQEQSINIVLSGELFSWKIVWIMILSTISFVMIDFCMTYCVQQQLIHEESLSTVGNDQCESDQSEGTCYKRNYPWIIIAVVPIISVFAIIGVMLFLHLEQRVTILEQHFELDTLWLEDISVILCVVIVSNINLIPLIYFRLHEHVPRFKDRSPILNKAVVFLHFIYFSIVCGTILLVHLQLRNKVSISDSLFSLYNSWLTDISMILGFLLSIFIVTTIAKSSLFNKKWCIGLCIHMKEAEATGGPCEGEEL